MGGCDFKEGDGVVFGRVMCVVLGCDIGEGDDGVMIGRASDGCGVGEGDECDVCYRTLRTEMTLVSTYRSLPIYSSWYVTATALPYQKQSTCNRSRKWFVCLSVCMYNVCMYVCMYVHRIMFVFIVARREKYSH